MPALSSQQVSACQHSALTSRRGSPLRLTRQRWGCRSRQRKAISHVEAAHNANDGIGAKIGRFARQLQGALPLVGIISRLASPSGGIASDKLAYPEFCRMVLDKPPEGFNECLQDWGQRHGPPGSRRLVMLFLWMAREGAALVPRQKVMSAAKRVRVTQDIEIEVERFEAAAQETTEKYEYVSPPEPALQQIVDMAVDALCLLSLGVKESETIPSADADALVSIVPGCFIGQNDLLTPEVNIKQFVELALSGRQERAAAPLR
ncbi:hypothetical protein WJX84_010755 [Apatococcus fuscideae]|uniref:Uncharacterized protein n=1 Tax=Apatococcus fuscideae TaxID=2026836 RepID=A0AAW1T0R5_9CHLO